MYNWRFLYFMILCEEISIDKKQELFFSYSKQILMIPLISSTENKSISEGKPVLLLPY